MFLTWGGDECLVAPVVFHSSWGGKQAMKAVIAPQHAPRRRPHEVIAAPADPHDHAQFIPSFPDGIVDSDVGAKWR